MSLVELVLEVHRHLDGTGISHAFASLGSGACSALSISNAGTGPVLAGTTSAVTTLG